jgi:hypothetical protein
MRQNLGQSLLVFILFIFLLLLLLLLLSSSLLLKVFKDHRHVIDEVKLSLCLTKHHDLWGC